MRDKEFIGIAEGVALIDVCSAIFEASLQRYQRRSLEASKRCTSIHIIDQRAPTRTKRVIDFRGQCVDFPPIQIIQQWHGSRQWMPVVDLGRQLRHGFQEWANLCP